MEKQSDFVLRTVASVLGIGLVVMWFFPVASYASERWYSKQQAEIGEAVYRANCMSCHLEAGAGAENWWKRDTEGRLPPPPLNGTAHTWHHDLFTLVKVVLDGGSRFGGSMPGFSSQLSAQEIVGVIAYVQSLWPDEIHDIWAESFPEDAARGIPIPDD